MAKNLQLKAEVRDRVGKGASRELRRNGMIPAVIYGDKKEPLSIALPRKEMTQLIQAGGFMTHLTDIEVGGEKHTVIAKDVQFEPVRDFLVHIDYVRVAKGAKLVVEVPVHFEGEDNCQGLKDGGVLNTVRHSVEVEAPATSIPESFTINLEGFNLGDSINVSAVDMPEGVVPTITDRDFTIATIAAPAALKSEESEEADTAAEDEAAEESKDEE
jgi:large subunit ribosomal protein L25